MKVISVNFLKAALWLVLLFQADVSRAAWTEQTAAETLHTWQAQSCSHSLPGQVPEFLLRFPKSQDPARVREVCSRIHQQLNIAKSLQPSAVRCTTWSDSELKMQLSISDSCRFQAIVDITADGATQVFWNEQQEVPGQSIPLPNLNWTDAPQTTDHWTQRVAGALRARTPFQVDILKGALLSAVNSDRSWSLTAREKPELKNWLLMLLEVSSTLGVGSLYYYTHQDWASTDWDLENSDLWKKARLSADAVSLDTNDLYVNGVAHPLAGMIYYLAARTNRLSPLESVAIAFVSSYLWETFVEVREKTSLNDLVFTPFAGAILGESLYTLTEFISCRFEKRHSLQSCAQLQSQMSVSVQARSGLQADEFGRPGEETEVAISSGLDRNSMDSLQGFQTLQTGDWTRLVATLGYLYDGDPRTRFNLQASTLLAGVEGVIRSLPASKRKGTYRIALDSGFQFNDSPMGNLQDRYAVLEFLGTHARLRFETGNLVIELQLRITTDLLMVESWAFSPWAAAQANPGAARNTADSSLRQRGFAHEWGASAMLQVNLQDIRRLWSISATVLERAGWKIEGADRFPERATHPVQDLTDERLSLQGTGDIAVAGTPVRVGVRVEHEVGKSSISGTQVSGSTTRVLGTLSFEFR